MGNTQKKIFNNFVLTLHETNIFYRTVKEQIMYLRGAKSIFNKKEEKESLEAKLQTLKTTRWLQRTSVHRFSSLAINQQLP